MATERKRTIKPAGQGGDYSSLSAWEAGEQADLVSLDEYRVGEIQGDWSGGADTTRVTIDGWTTDSTRYIIVRAVGNNAVTGCKWDDTKYKLDCISSSNSLQIQEFYTRIQRIQIRNNYAGHWSSVVAVWTEGGFSIVDGCAIIQNPNGFYIGGTVALDPIAQLSGPVTIVNCFIRNMVAYDDRSIGIENYSHPNTQTMSHYIYNNTIIGGGAGIGSHDPDNAFCCINNLIYGQTVRAFKITSGIWTGSDYNATDDDIGLGTPNERLSQTFIFVDAANGNYDLSPLDKGARGYGANLSSDSAYAFNYDIDSRERIGPWDIGADQVNVDRLLRVSKIRNVKKIIGGIS